MKVILVLLVLCGVGLAIVYYAGGSASFDPTEQGKKMYAAITPGMPWTKVVALGQPPSHYRPFRLEVRGTGANEVRSIKLGSQNKYNADKIAARIADGKLEHGFAFDYRFSERCAFRVVFDETGAVDHMQELVTMSHLLQLDE